MTLHAGAWALATPSPDESAPQKAWDTYFAACERVGHIPTDTHDSAAIHCFLLAMTEHGWSGQDDTIRWLIQTNCVPR